MGINLYFAMHDFNLIILAQFVAVWLTWFLFLWFFFICLFLFLTWCPAPWYLHVQLHWIHAENCVTNMAQHVCWCHNLTDKAKHALQSMNLHASTRNLNLRTSFEFCTNLSKWWKFSELLKLCFPSELKNSKIFISFDTVQKILSKLIR